MAILHKLTAAEALNTDTSGVWNVQTKVTTTNTDGTDINVTGYHNVMFDTSSVIDVLFDNTTDTACSDANDLKLKAGITTLKIPLGLGTPIYLHWRRDGGTDSTVRIILT